MHEGKNTEHQRNKIFQKVVRQKLDLGLFDMSFDFEATLWSSEKRAHLKVPKSHFVGGCHGNIGIYLKFSGVL